MKKTSFHLVIAVTIVVLTVASASPSSVLASSGACPLLECQNSFFFTHHFEWTGEEENLDCYGGNNPQDQTCHSAAKGGSCGDNHPICGIHDDALELVQAYEQMLGLTQEVALSHVLTKGGSLVRYDRDTGELAVLGCGDQVVAAILVDQHVYDAALALADQ